MTKRIIFLLLLVCTLPCRAAERALALTDKDLYLTGERLHVSVCIVDDDMRPSSLSCVAYVEISDSYRLCAQGLVSLVAGRGWADIALPASLHSGNYLLTVYTRAMRNLDLTTSDALFSKVISIVNPTHLSRADDIIFLPTDSIPLPPAISQATFLTSQAGQSVALPAELCGDLLFSSLSVMRHDLLSPDYSTLLMVGFYYGGHWLLRIFNCDIHSFATAGGFLMFLMALEMILDVEIFKNNTPNKGATMVPMVFPLIAGAGVLTTLISLKAMYDDVNIFIGLAINMIWVFLVIKSTGKIQQLLGDGGMMFSRKFFGIILLAMSVKMMTENIAHLF